MRKNIPVKPILYPQPVLIIASYDEAEVPNAMNAAWGCMADYDKIAMVLAGDHKTVKNILARGAFSVSMADAAHVTEADYVGIVSGNDVPNKLEKAGLHTAKSEFVDAPVIEELPLAFECKLISYDEESELMIGEIVNISADECILGEDGKIDVGKLDPIVFDAVHNAYRTLGGKVGNAFRDGLQLK